MKLLICLIAVCLVARGLHESTLMDKPDRASGGGECGASPMILPNCFQFVRRLHICRKPFPNSLTMAKRAMQTDVIVKLIVGAGQASPSPPVGPALGSKGVKSMDFCKVCARATLSHSRKMFSVILLTFLLTGIQC
jgi:hypothetical protein